MAENIRRGALSGLTAASIALAFFILPASTQNSDAWTRTVPGAGWQDSLTVGDAAPSFVMDDLATGEPVFLSDFTGRTLRQPWKNNSKQVVVLCFWTSVNADCMQEIEGLSRVASELSDKPVVFFLVNTKEQAGVSTDAIKQVVAERGFRLRVLLDATGTVADRYGVHTLPATFVADKKGVLRMLHQGSGSTSGGSLEKLLGTLAAEPELN